MDNICGASFSFDHAGPPDMIENDLTGGAYRVMVGRAPAGEGPPLHVHPHITQPLRGLLIYSPGDAEHITQPV